MDKFGRQDAKASKNIWHRIHRNIFTHREPKSVTEDDVLICACVPDPETGKGCGPDCINRDVLVECDPAFCPCGDGCQNQKFQKKDYAKLDIQRTGRKGHGLFTKQALKKGQFIIEYIGEVLHEDEMVVVINNLRLLVMVAVMVVMEEEETAEAVVVVKR